MALRVALAVLWLGRDASGLSATCWGAIDDPGCRGVDLRPATEIYSNAKDFVALDKQSGLVQFWGADDSPSSALTSMVVPGVSHVFSTDDVILLWNNETHETVFWGSFLPYNTRAHRSLNTYTSIHTTGGAVLFLNMQTGESLCMGNAAAGGRCHHLNLTGVTEVYGSHDSFLALDRSSGALHCWGAIERWGGCPGTIGGAEDLQIHSSGSAFLALNKRTGEAKCWGNPRAGGDCARRNLSGATEVHSTDSAFMALDASTGEAQCWGAESAGGNCTGMNLSGATDVYSTGGAFMALNRKSGEAQCWGTSASGGNCSGLDFRGVTGVFATKDAFVALKAASGEAECWGHPERGGSCSGFHLPGASHVYSTHRSFMAVARHSALPPPPPQGPWRHALLVLAGAIGGMASLAAAACFRHTVTAKAKMWDHQEPLPPKTASELSWLQLHSASLEKKATSFEGKECAGARRSRARAARARDRMNKLLARAALQAAGGPENWGISVEQLIAFYSEHRDRMQWYCQCHRLADNFSHVCMSSPCDHDHGDAVYRQLLPGEAVESLNPVPFNMHTVVSNVIKPSTKDHQGIMGYWARLNLPEPRKVETFISHCWNEQFSDLVATLRTLRHDTVVWVCSFALPQNIDIGRVLGVDVYNSPFARALAEADRVLLAVDDALEPLTRSWCCFELYLTVSKEKRLDIRAHVTSPGLYQAISRKAALMDIRHCTATSAGDHQAIMRALRGAEDAVNRRVRQHVEDTVQFITSFVP